MQLRNFTSPVQSVARLEAAAAQQMFQQSLFQAQARVSHNWEAGTVQWRNRAMQGFGQWLQQLPSEWNKTLLTCTPADVVVYLESHWLAQHAGTTLPDGGMIASPKGVSQCLSSCSTGFKLLGRVGEWNPLSNSGNPVESTLINQYRKGYRLEAWRSGYLEGSAVPMHSSKVFQLVDHIDQLLVGTTSPVSQLTLQRDIVLLLLMLETPMRGIDCGKLSWADFFLPSGGQAPFPLGDCPSVLVKPNGTKTVKGQRSGPFTLTASQDAKHSCLPRLLIYLELLHSAGYAGSKFLFRPLLPNRKGFQDEPMTGSNLGKRLNKHLQDAGVYAGESNHGFRRGQIQRMVANGMSKAAIGEATQIKTLSIVDLYADVSRHIPRLERLLKRPAAAMA